VRTRTKAAPGRAGGDPAASQPVTTGQPQQPPAGVPAGQAGSTEDAAPAERRRNSRRRLRNWRVRSRLMLLVIIPTASAIALGAISVTSSARNALAYQRVQTLATLGRDIVNLAQALEDERDQIAVFIGMPLGGRQSELSGHPGQAALQLSVIGQAFSTTNQDAARVRALAAQIGGGYSPQARQAAATALSSLARLPFLRDAALRTRLPVLVVVQDYAQLIDDVLALNSQIAQESNDPALAQAVQVLGLVAAMQEAASEQRAILVDALLQGGFGPGQLTALEAAQSAQQSNLGQFNISANVAQQRLWDASVSPVAYLASSDELQAISLAQKQQGSLAGDSTSPADWYGHMSNPIDIQMASVEQRLASQIIGRASVLRADAIRAALVVGAAVLLILVIALILTVIVGRSMVRPLRRLRAGALDVAGVRLPEAVRRMSEAEGSDVVTDIEPIDVDSFDEIGEVARAFDQVHREAIRLAANEAALRGNVNAMFVNLSRRSQSLVERQIRLIDDLEQGEQDPERLASLFQMDHLATRMRRNSENLLVLAGHESSRRWNQPVPLVDVLRAAISEIEQYERVTLNVQPGILVRGPAVSDVVHLLAELAENATSFSSAETPVSVSGHLLSSGGVLLDITDQGVGMSAEEMAHANWRLDNPPVVDVAVSRRMGLFVVARLAARHGIRVRLRPAAGAGLTALVWLPDEVIVRESGVKPGSPSVLSGQVARAALEPVAPSRPSARFGARAGGEWPGEKLRSSAEQEVAAARAPRFTPASPTEGNGTGIPHRIPGAGPHPGRARTTGPLPAIGRGPGRPGAGATQADAVPEPEAGPRGAPARPLTWTGESRPATSVWGQEQPSAPVAGAPVAGVRLGGAFRSPSSSFGTPGGEVIVPPAVPAGDENRLPIFEAVESDWFRRGRPSMDWQGGGVGVQATAGWSSPADAGWRAAEAAAAPSSGGTTAAGLPRRVPRANLIPGTAADAPAASAPLRSPAATRERFASLQRGVREGRAAGAAEKGDAIRDVPGDG